MIRIDMARHDCDDWTPTLYQTVRGEKWRSVVSGHSPFFQRYPKLQCFLPIVRHPFILSPDPVSSGALMDAEVVGRQV